MNDDCCGLHQCLYFTANSLCRAITRLADEEFAITGISPSHAFLLRVVSENPGIMQKDLGVMLNFAPSTVTRFVDHLIRRGLAERRVEGRAAQIYPTERGLMLQPTIAAAWQALYNRYYALLGQEAVRELTQMLHAAAERLEIAE